ncbi:MAG: hypothetical protein E6G68_05035 [Actinobacteria bacterium]|nr:MAG: hypothetical protein E6G68_05035 [Actinomycetota bacterium]
MRKTALMTFLSVLIFVSAAALPANATAGAFQVAGTANLNSGSPCTGGVCNGTLLGVLHGVFASPTVNCATGCPFTGSFTYDEPGGMCVAGIPIAPLGTANGSIALGTIGLNFTWTRVGLTALVLLSGPSTTGVAVFVFVPPQTCNPSSETFVGAGAFF